MMPPSDNRYQPETESETESRPLSSVGGESVDTLDSALTHEAEFTADSQDILIETDQTNKPLAELLKVSRELRQAEVGRLAAVSSELNLVLWLD